MTIQEQLSTLPQSTLDAAERNAALKQAPSYGAWLAEHKDNLRYGDSSPSAAMQQRTNGSMRIVDHLWQQVLDETA